MKKPMQNDRIIGYMRAFGTINPMQALNDLSVMRLAARISELKSAGYKIKKKTVSRINRLGEKVSFAEYSLDEGEKANV